MENVFYKILEKNTISLPKVILASTIKGKGVKSMESKLSSHYETLTTERFEDIMKDLY